MKGNEELTSQDQGVGEQVTAEGGVTEQPTAGVSGAAIAGGEVETGGEERAGAVEAGRGRASPQQAQPVDLTQSEEFRRWQASRDRAEAALRQQMEQAARANQEMQRQLEELQLRDADPEEVAAYYQRRAQEVEGEAQQQVAAWQERLAIQERAGALLDELGISPDNPGLEWGDEPSWEAVALLAQSAARVKALEAQVVAGEGKGAAQQAAEVARVEALRTAGVTAVGAPTGGAPVKQNPIAEINDPDELLKMGMGGKGGGRSME